MITEAVLWVLANALSGIASLLPVGDVDLPDVGGIGAKLGEMTGPVDRFAPVSELVTFLTIVWSVWAPAAAVYTLTFWVYRHTPVLGKG